MEARTSSSSSRARRATGGRTDTRGEAAAIRTDLTGGKGGAAFTDLLKYLSTDNSALADLFGATPSALPFSSGTVSITATVALPRHPLAAGLGSTFQLLNLMAEQGISRGWSSASLASGASLVILGSGQCSVVADEASTCRRVGFSGMPDYAMAGFDSQKAISNALLWPAAYP